MKRRNTYIAFIALSAIFIALNMVITIFISIPMPGGQGYLNLSDAIILLLASLIHPLVGAIVGALSGGLSDLILGYGVYVPVTFFIKGIEGLVVGYILRFSFKNFKNTSLYFVVPACILGGLLMMSGYFFFEWIVFDISVAAADLFGNFCQGLVGAIIASILFYSLFKLPIYKNLGVMTNASLIQNWAKNA